MKHIFTIVSFILLTTLATLNVSAMGISRSYIEGDKLKMGKCDIKQVELELQNVESKDIFVEVPTSSTGCAMVHILNLQEFYHLLPNHNGDKKVILEIVTPDSCKVNDTFKINYGMKVAESQFGLIFNQDLDIEIVDELGDCELADQIINIIDTEKIEKKQKLLDSIESNKSSLFKSPGIASPMSIKIKKHPPVWLYTFIFLILVVFGTKINRYIKTKKENKKRDEYNEQEQI